eukprot:gene8495-9362_t
MSSSKHPICLYLTLPDNEELIQEAILRSGLIRRVVEVWADAEDLPTAVAMVDYSFPFLCQPLMPHPQQHDAHGADDKTRRILLSHFATALRQLPGEVSLDHPAHHLIFYEDFSDYQYKHNHFQQTGEKEMLDSMNKPNRIIFGRVVAHGRNIAYQFDLVNRPFLGTTSMKAICSHVTAQAALVGQGDLILDPFCGTGSILVACAALGADVLGSDIDPHACGGENSNKNGKFQRSVGREQEGQTAKDNFIFYNLLDRLKDLQHKDALQWLEDDDDNHNNNNSIQFDGIVADPPFGRRERVCLPVSFIESLTPHAGELDAMGSRLVNETLSSPFMVVALLLRLAERRLKAGRRLAFWIATNSDIEQHEVEAFLEKVNEEVLVKKKSLSLLRVTAEELRRGMWRWLVVYEKEGEVSRW